VPGTTTVEPTGFTSDDDLDVVQAGITVAADGGMTATVKVVKMDPVGPYNSTGDQHIVRFNAGGVASTISLGRDTSSDVTFATLKVAATVSGIVKFDPPTNTATGTFTADQVKTAFGKGIAGVKLDTFATSSYNFTANPTGVGTTGLGFPLVDSSSAPTSMTYTDAGGCGAAGGGTPAPSGSATPAPSGSATPAPSSSPSATPSATPSASPPAATTDADGLYFQPRKGCVNFTDPAADADPTGIGVFNEGSLDVTAVNLKSPSGALQVIVKLANASEALLDVWDGRIYDVTFTVAGKAVVLQATADGPATATVAGKASADVKATAKTDAKASSIVFTVPLAGLSKAVGASVLPGTAITATAVETSADSLLGAFTADEAAGAKPAEKTYAYGDNTCFLPPAGILSLVADPSGQYTDVTVAYATLTDVDEAPVQGATVMGVLTGGKTAFGVTDEDGVAEIRLPIAVPAGAKTLKVAYAGNADIGAAAVTAPFTVKAEKVLLKAVGTKGGVTATLTDDDKRVVAGQTVVFTIGTKKYAVKTSSRGVAALGKIKRGTAVKISYAGAKNLFLATPSYTVKAL
jgi:hypothetical protein